jgi:hypothetical protein
MSDHDLAQSVLYHATLTLKHRAEDTAMQQKHFDIEPTAPIIPLLDPKRIALYSSMMGLTAGCETMAIAQEINALYRSKGHTEWLEGLKHIAETYGLNYEDTYL